MKKPELKPRADIEQSLQLIHDRIRQAADKSGRKAEDIQLLAVSKTKPAAAIKAAYHAGQRHFGENYCQEARAKQEELADMDICWHFIGPIQSNKTREIAEHFDWVHSVDRLKIAKRLNDQRPVQLPPLNICLQINIDDETTKAGISLHELPPLLEQLKNLPNIKVRGLMAIPAPKATYAEQLASFQKLAEAKEALSDVDTLALSDVGTLALSDVDALGFSNMDTLSMGMSADLEAAIAAGSTIVRVGTGVFGKRDVQ